MVIVHCGIVVCRCLCVDSGLCERQIFREKLRRGGFSKDSLEASLIASRDDLDYDRTWL
jgi:hypothetical protein